MEKKRSFLVTELLCLCFGVCGAHRFYTGYVGIGVIQLLTCGGFFLWAFVDLISISLGKYRDFDENELENYNQMVGLAVLSVVIFIVLWIFSPHHNNTPVKNNVNRAEIQSADGFQLQNISNVNYSFKKLKPELIEYIKSSNEYGGLYNDGRKFVIYFTGANCPYARSFNDSFLPLVSSGDFSDYQFHAESASGMKTFNTMEEAKANTAFSNLCHEFCILNPQKDELFSISGIGQDEADQIEDILTQLKNW